MATPIDPASQPAILKANGRPRTPVPTMDTMIFPKVWIDEAEPVMDGVAIDEDSNKGAADPFAKCSMRQLCFSSTELFYWDWIESPPRPLKDEDDSYGSSFNGWGIVWDDGDRWATVGVKQHISASAEIDGTHGPRLWSRDDVADPWRRGETPWRPKWQKGELPLRARLHT